MSETAANPHYGRVWLTFLRNSLVREMTFRGNFVITIVTRAFWFTAQLVLFEIVYRNVATIGAPGTADAWTREEYFAFMATGMLINAFVEAFFMPNCANFSELIRKGDLDFALLKPIDTQFLVSFEKVEVAMLGQVVLSLSLLGYSVWSLGTPVTVLGVAMYALLIVLGVAFFYSLMIALASTSIWFGRNQGLYDFWFYITVFARYPRSIYSGSVVGELLRFAFSYVIPILLVVSVPARVLLTKALEPNWLTVVAIVATGFSVFVSRRIFNWSLNAYRSASS